MNWKHHYFRRALLSRFKKPPKRLSRILYPELIESRYRIALDEYLKTIKRKVDEKIIPMLPELQRHYGRERKDEDDIPKKFYTAFIYSPTADARVLHCTHKYLGELTKEDRIKVEKIIDAYFLKPKVMPYVTFYQREMFGPDKDVPVLVASPVHTDPFPDLRAKLDSFKADDYPYRMHVTTDQPKLNQPFSNYALISKKGIERIWPETVRTDVDDESTLGNLADELEAVRIETAQAYTPAEIKRLAQVTGKSIEDWNARQMNGQLHGIVEVDVFGSEPWLAREAGAFVVNNVSLIKSIETEYLGQVEKIIANSVRSGIRVEDIASELEDRYDVARSRAELIARDQVGKFQGQLTELRQKDLGVDRYRWRTAGDARVRETHRENAARITDLGEGIYAWDDPPAETGHPGQDYQCRCWAEPVLADFFDSDT